MKACITETYGMRVKAMRETVELQDIKQTLTACIASHASANGKVYPWLPRLTLYGSNFCARASGWTAAIGIVPDPQNCLASPLLEFHWNLAVECDMNRLQWYFHGPAAS